MRQVWKVSVGECPEMEEVVINEKEGEGTDEVGKGWEVSLPFSSAASFSLAFPLLHPHPSLICSVLALSGYNSQSQHISCPRLSPSPSSSLILNHPSKPAPPPRRTPHRPYPTLTSRLSRSLSHPNRNSWTSCSRCHIPRKAASDRARRWSLESGCAGSGSGRMSP